MADRIPIVVLGGWLGSGKTTLVNRTLEHCARSRPERIAVIVNDVGDVNIDAALVAAHDGDTIELTDGCICCSIGDSLAITLRDLVGQARWDRIVVEASGVAEPARVAAYGSRRLLDPQGAVVTVDATDVVERIADDRYGSLVRRQLQQADVLVLTKADLVTAARPGAVAELCDRLAPGVPMLPAGPEVLLEPAASRYGSVSAGSAPAPEVAIRTWCPDEPVDPEAVVAVLERSRLLRAKGAVPITGGAVQVQLAAGRVSLGPARSGVPSALVLIGPDPDAVEEALVSLALSRTPRWSRGGDREPGGRPGAR